MIDLGKCCACEKDGADVRNLMMHDFKTPSGHGWGCLQCGLPMEGATSVICDGCLESGAEILWIIDGQADDKGRIRISEIEKIPFEHDMSKHPEEGGSSVESQ